MQAFDARQCEILELMGVEVWRLRAGSGSASPPETDDVDNANVTGPGSEVSTHWLLTQSIPGEPGGPLIVRTVGRTELSRSADRLTAAIATALGATSSAACQIDARQAPPDVAEPDGLPKVLRDALSQLNPPLVVSLGRDCGDWLSRSLKNCGVTVPPVLLAEDPETLLTQPELKAELWRRFLSMRREDTGA